MAELDVHDLGIAACVALFSPVPLTFVAKSLGREDSLGRRLAGSNIYAMVLHVCRRESGLDIFSRRQLVWGNYNYQAARS